MDKAIFEKIPFNRRRLTLCGLGEPLLHPNFIEFIRIAKSRGAGVDFSTNGILLTKDVAERLVSLGIDEITFSIDGIGEHYEQIRRGSSFERVVDNLKYLHSLSNENGGKPRIQITFVGLTSNLEQFPRVVEFFAPYVSAIRFNHVAPYSQEIADLHVLKMPRDEVQSIIDEARKIANERGVKLRLRPLEPTPSKICWEPWVKPYIAMDGTVYPCCILGDHHGLKFTEYFEDAPITYDLEQYAMGNLADEKFDEIWNNEEFIRFRKRLKTLRNQSRKKWTLKEYVELRKQGTDFFCEICSFRWGVVC
jgi:MoaA/NifB/PqqE/SkfB family radical SAM enzyme